jgi:DNA integrity scanning protein DisA with diadenylate cyclase activity
MITIPVFILLGILIIVIVDTIHLRLSLKRQLKASLEWIEQHEKFDDEFSYIDDNLTDLVLFSRLNRVIATKTRLYTENVFRQKGVLQSENPSLPTYETDVAYLMRVPGIGEAIADKLLKEFGTIVEIRDASIEELEKVDKVGPQLAKNIKTYLAKGAFITHVLKE